MAKHLKSIRWIPAVVLLPFAVLGLLALVTQLLGLVGYDPAYSTPTYVERYQAANVILRLLERTLQRGDRALLAELEGLRWPMPLPTGAVITFVMFWDRTDRHTTYLYLDRQAYQRYLVCFRLVNGRWVVAPRDLYLGMHLGAWRSAFLPLVMAWWLLGGVLPSVVWLSRRTARRRI